MLKTGIFLKKLLFHEFFHQKRGKSLTKDNINQYLKQIYLMDTDDSVYLKSVEIKKKIKEQPGCYQFDTILEGNSGDMQSSGYPPITFNRQVVCATLLPSLIKDSSFPDDVKLKAKEALQHHVSLGSYSVSPGVEMFRKKLAEYITKRDGGVECDYNYLILNDGVTEGIRTILKLLDSYIDNKPPGLMIPSPSYPFGLLEEYGFTPIYYYLNEEINWVPNIEEMKKTLKNSKLFCTPKAILVINPNNPTGTVFKKDTMEEIIKFACEEKLIILADEIYQMNVYKGHKFLSFKKVLHEMGKPYSDMELSSFFGISKGILGEPGIRAGIMEVHNFNKEIMEQIRKLLSTRLCSCTAGQVMIYTLANHPIEGDPSFELWKEETECRSREFQYKAEMIVNSLNKIDGFSCKPIEGTFFAYPKITIPESFAIEGISECYNPSTFYALRLLEETGVLVTPGDVFGCETKPHIRISILPKEDKLVSIVEKVESFNNSFLNKFSY